MLRWLWAAVLVSGGLTATEIPPGASGYEEPLDTRYLPSPPPHFGGVINLNASDSTPWWPPTVVPPEGAPNILLIMTDDVGYGAPSTFGGSITYPCVGPDCGEWTALHIVSFDSALFADARCVDHWA